MNFKEVKQKIKTFINDELISLEPWIVNSEWSEKLPKLNELRDKVKEMGFWLPSSSWRLRFLFRFYSSTILS